jgi:hypothetical protein
VILAIILVLDYYVEALVIPALAIACYPLNFCHNPLTPYLIIHFKYLLNDQENMFKNHALESCIEGFITVKECSKKLDRSTLKRAWSEQTGCWHPVTRNCEYLYSPLRVAQLATASSWRVNTSFCGVCLPWRVIARRCEL